MDLQLIRTNAEPGKAIDDRLQKSTHAWKKVHVADILVSRVVLCVLSPYLQHTQYSTGYHLTIINIIMSVDNS